MMLFGLGVDIASVTRLHEAHEKWGERLALFLLDPREEYIAYKDVAARSDTKETQHCGRFLAKRFAAKEAAAKALGSGIGKHAGWRDFRMTHDRRGKPLLRFSGRAARSLHRAGITGNPSVHLSLSDLGDMVIAVVAIDAPLQEHRP